MNRHVVVRNVRRVDPDIIAGLGAAGTATVHEAIGRRGFVGSDIRPIQHGVRLAGSAVTVSSHPGDNLMIHAAVEVCAAGDVLVVTNTAPSTHGMFGELLAYSLMARGVRGLVIDAGVRDTLELRALGFPVWTRHVSCQGTVKASPGSVNVPVVLGGVVISPGDVICADDDGVVVVPADDAGWALEQSTARIAKEDETRTKLQAGELGLDLYGLRAKLAELGVEYVDSHGAVTDARRGTRARRGGCGVRRRPRGRRDRGLGVRPGQRADAGRGRPLPRRGGRGGRSRHRPRRHRSRRGCPCVRRDRRRVASGRSGRRPLHECPGRQGGAGGQDDGARAPVFVDVALMTPVPGRGLRTPSLVSGPGAERYAAALRPLGVPVEIVGDRAGDASTRKLLRSVTMKGLAADRDRSAFGRPSVRDVAEWLWDDLVAEMEAADAGLLERLVRGTGVHAGRRVHEMEASAALLSSLGVDPVMTRATIEALRQAARHGVPEVPGQTKS